MKMLAIVKSKHNDNTMKIAEAMSEAAPLTVADLKDALYYNLNEYDVIGFGSGIYFGKHDEELFEFINKYCSHFTNTFVFSTSGSKNYKKNNSALVKLLESKNKTILGSFGCRGLDKFFIFALLGGINKNHPDTDDFDAAQQFIESIVNRYNQLKN